MTALTADRKTDRREGALVNDPVAAGVTIYAGALTVLDGSGDAAPGSTATGLTARGVAQERIDNSGGSAGDKHVEVRRGIHKFANSGGDPIDRTHIGGTAYIVDDQTVSATDGGGTQSAAGKIFQVDSDGVWVDVG